MTTSTIALRGEAAEVVLSEAQAVRSMVQDESRRARLADLIAAAQAGEVSADDSDALTELLELGLQTGRLRSVYGPGGEQAALRLFRRLPRGKELNASARDVSAALSSLVGKQLESARVETTGPGSFLVSLAVDGRELSVRLDRNGVRLASVGL